MVPVVRSRRCRILRCEYYLDEKQTKNNLPPSRAQRRSGPSRLLNIAVVLAAFEVVPIGMVAAVTTVATAATSIESFILGEIELRDWIGIGRAVKIFGRAVVVLTKE